MERSLKAEMYRRQTQTGEHNGTILNSISTCRTEVVETKKGFVQGRSITQLGGEFHLDPVDVFLGIPYALPPVGPRR